MLFYASKLFYWTQIWILIMLYAEISSGNCPTKCSNCRYDSSGDVISAVCKDVQIPTLPNTLQELQVSDATGMTVIMFHRFRPFVLAGMSELSILKIQSYQISTLSGECFQGSPGLQTLDLSKNVIGQISEINFKGLQYLSYLSLKQNQLTTLGSFVFRQLTVLENLSLALNRLYAIGEDDFKGLGSIKEINLRSNRITAIHKFAFQGLKTLETIDLQSNELTRIGSGLFKILPNLKILSLQKNQISYIDPESMTNTPVTSINLMDNDFNKLPTEFLQNVSNERLEVNLSRNNISKIDAGELQKIVLKTLFLVANSITIVHPNALCESFIKKLDLEQNLLKHLPEGLHNSLNQSNIVILNNNPWSCDCDIKWMHSLLKDIAEPVCAQPLIYHGQNLSQILDDLEISCGVPATLTVPPMHLRASPHHEKNTTTFQATTKTTIQQTANLKKNEGKGSDPKTAVIAGTVCGVTFLVSFIVLILIYLYKKKVTVTPELS